MIKSNPWTLVLVSAGLVSLPAISQAEEKVNSVLTSLSSTTLSGYIDTSAQWNIGTGDQNVPNYAFGGSSKADGFNLNVVKLSLEHPVDPAEAWGAGYKLDLLFGPDANSLATQSLFGNGSSAATGDFAIQQAYVDLKAPVGNGLDFKMGVFNTIIGYEVFDSINNPNVTRSYGYSIEPTTHTGILGTYQFCESFSASVGVANTFGPQINQRTFVNSSGMYLQAESYKAYMGSFTITAPTNMSFLAGSTLTACIINGFNSGTPASSPSTVATAGTTYADQTSYYVGATFNTPVTGLKVGACYDYAGVSGQSLTLGNSGYANAVGGYISYQLTEKLSVYGRGEYATSSNPATFMASKIVEATATLQYDLWKNVLSRLEFRWDHAADGTAPYGGTGNLEPGQPGGLANSYILLADVSYKF
jgi:hypothetical protein